MRRLPRRRSLLLAAATLTGFLAAAGPAAADPVRGHEAVPIALTCAGESFLFISPNEPTPAGQLIGGTSVVVATAAHLVTSFVDPETGNPVTDVIDVVYGAGHGAAIGVNSQLTTCTATNVVDDPMVGPITANLTLTVAVHP